MNYCVIVNMCTADWQLQLGRSLTFVLQNDLRDGICTLLLITSNSPDNSLSVNPAPAYDIQRLASIFHTRTVYLISAYDTIHPEVFLESIIPVIRENTVALFPDNCFGEELAIRSAIRAQGCSITGALNLSCIQKNPVRLMAEKKIYSGYIAGSYTADKTPVCLTVDRSIIPASQEQTERFATGTKLTDIHKVSVPEVSKSYLSNTRITTSETDDKLHNAQKIVVIGRGVRNKSNTLKLRDFFQKAGFAFGGTRPAALSAWVLMSELIGVSGEIVHPKICVTIGVSGAPALYSGIENSQTIIAINSDPEAPINEKCDFFLPCDWKELFTALEKIRSHSV